MIRRRRARRYRRTSSGIWASVSSVTMQIGNMAPSYRPNPKVATVRPVIAYLDHMQLKVCRSNVANTTKGTVSKNQVNANGDRHGCHICGTRQPGTQTGNWTLDRIPAEHIAGPDVAVQHVFPSCTLCMSNQG